MLVWSGTVTNDDTVATMRSFMSSDKMLHLFAKDNRVVYFAWVNKYCYLASGNIICSIKYNKKSFSGVIFVPHPIFSPFVEAV